MATLPVWLPYASDIRQCGRMAKLAARCGLKNRWIYPYKFESCCAHHFAERRNENIIYKKEPVRGYEDYSVDVNGIVYSKKGKPLKYSINYRGYQIINFYVNHQRKGFGVHTLVAKQFIPNDDLNKTHVNHMDGNKQNNNVDNLEWTTPLENRRHAIEILGKNDREENNPRARAIKGVDKNGKTLNFNSIIKVQGILIKTTSIMRDIYKTLYG